MKKLILLLLFFNVSFSQPMGMGIEIRLTDAAYWNDAGLTTILDSHDVIFYQTKGGHPYPGLLCRIYQTTGADDLPSLLADLLNYTAVVESAVITDASNFSDCYTAKLLNANVGVPVGFSGDNVATNDPGLNTIFQNFNVYFDTQTYPSSASPSLLRYYSLACHCNVEQLRDALDAYTTVIETTEPNGVVYLSLNENHLAPLKIYPNPFKASFEIESQNEVAHYYLTDVSGKLVVDTDDYAALQHQLPGLKSGVYVLKLQFAGGLFETRKVVKL
jgi:hypothetical protein